jgi:hypothetical protein
MSLPITVSTSYRQPESWRINQIIPEVLSLIFLQTYYASRNYHFGSVRSCEAPLIFLQICKQWSAVAYATPELWSSLGYILGHVGEKSGRDAVMINQWLARAKTCPLWLKLRTSSYFDQSSHPVLETFIFHSHRWQHVDFALPPSVFPALNTVKGSLPLLRTLEFTLPDIFSIDPPRLDAFGGASSLRSLALLQNIRPRMVEIPWPQLTQCSICVDTEGLDVFRHLSNISKLTLMFNLDATLPQSHFEPPTRLPFLRTLSITCLKMSNPASFWNGLIVPALSDINFRRSAGQTNSWAPEIYLFISRWASTIRRLTLCNAHLADDELVRCIREITLLEKLEIDEEGRSDYVSNDFMRLLHFDPDSSSCLAPKLQYIGFKGFYYLFDDNVFMDMVASRWRPRLVSGDVAHQVSCLKAIMLRPQRALDRQVVNRLDKLKEEGLGVFIFGN